MSSFHGFPAQGGFFRPAAIPWLVLLVFAAFVWTFIAYVRAEHDVVRASERRYQSTLLANELRQSSDDLTRMVRTYVSTGNPVYKAYFQEILDIRDGRRPRPLEYNAIYWDLVMIDGQRPRPDGEAISLLELMRNAGFTADEFELLSKAKKNSDVLSRIEFSAMGLIESITSSPDEVRALAVHMVHDQNYHQAKAGIMKPIGDFYAMVDKRTLEVVRNAETTSAYVLSILVVEGGALVFLVFLVRRREIERADQLQKMNEELAMSRDAAEAASRAKNAFLSNISHELRTPLHQVHGMAQLIQREPLTQKQMDRMGKLTKSCHHLTEIVDAILGLTKLEAGKAELREDRLLLDDLVDEAVISVREEAAAKHLLLTTEAIPASSPLVGDKGYIRQALLNYLLNAVRFTDTGNITVRTKIVAETGRNVLVRFEVQDTGVGIAPDDLPRLFTIFEQVDNSSTRKFEGLGAGLAVTKKIAQVMGGDAGCSSVPGFGSTFWFTVNLRSIVAE